MRTELAFSRRRRRATFVAAATLAGSLALVPGSVSAEGLFDFLFSGVQKPARQARRQFFSDPFGANQPAHPAPAPRVAGSGPAFCVRSCDGIGVLVGYTPGVDPSEYLAVAQAGRVGRRADVHALARHRRARAGDARRRRRRAGARRGDDRRAHALLPHQLDVVAPHRPRARRSSRAASRRAGTSRPRRIPTDRAPPRSAPRSSRPSACTNGSAGRARSPTSRPESASPTRRGCASSARPTRAGWSSPSSSTRTIPHDRALLRRSLTFPDAIVASDAMPPHVDGHARPDLAEWPLPPEAVTHPRTAGTFRARASALARRGRAAHRGDPKSDAAARVRARGGGARDAQQGASASRRRRRSRRVRRRRASPTKRPTRRARARRPGSHTCSSTACSSCATASSCSTRRPGRPIRPTQETRQQIRRRGGVFLRVHPAPPASLLAGDDCR